MKVSVMKFNRTENSSCSQVFDLAQNKAEPVSMQKIVGKAALTRLAFNLHHPILVVGDDKYATDHPWDLCRICNVRMFCVMVRMQAVPLKVVPLHLQGMYTLSQVVAQPSKDGWHCWRPRLWCCATGCNRQCGPEERCYGSY